MEGVNSEMQNQCLGHVAVYHDLCTIELFKGGVLLILGIMSLFVKSK